MMRPDVASPPVPPPATGRPRVRGRRFAGRPPAWVLNLVGGAVIAMIVLLLESGWLWNILWEVVPISAVVGVVAGIRRNRPADPLPWMLVGLGVLLWLTADLGWTVWYAVTGEDPPAVSVLDIVYLSSYPALIIGLARLPGPAVRHDVSATLDTVVVTAGLGLMSWSLMINPLLSEHRLDGLVLALAVAYPLFDLVMVFFATRLIFLRGSRSLSQALLSAAFAFLLMADTVVTLDLAAGGGSSGGLLANIGWMGWAVLTGTAALHPSMAGIDQVGDVPLAHLGRVRVGIFLLLIIAAPMPFLLQVKSGEVGGQETGWPDILVPFGFIVAIMLSILVRLNMITKVAERRAFDLDRQAESLAEALREEEALKRQITHRALHDPLTGLANRALFQDRLDQAMARRGDVGKHALLFLDVDGFKDVNDTHGHPVGDELLVCIAQRLRRVLREADTIARLGGDEFATVIEQVTLDDAREIAGRVIESVSEPYVIGDRRVHVTTSVGLLMVEAPMSSADALRDADLALYSAKAAGKNRVGVFDPGLRVARLDRVRMTAALREALDRDEFALHYQPVVELGGRRVQGVEALLRWTPEGGRPIPPDEFIPLAEETGLIVPIGTWVLRKACTDAREWYERYGVYVTVNISGRQLQRPDFVQTVLGVLKETGLPPQALVLELTETVLLATTKAETRRLTGRLEELRHRGVRIALDDFGTGYSSLAYLRYLPIDVVKIDQSFMQSDDDLARQGQAFTRAIIDLCRVLRLNTVAEGVETPAQHDFLRRLHCALGQGYLYGRPMPAINLQGVLTGVTDDTGTSGAWHATAPLSTAGSSKAGSAKAARTAGPANAAKTAGPANGAGPGLAGGAHGAGGDRADDGDHDRDHDRDRDLGRRRQAG